MTENPSELDPIEFPIDEKTFTFLSWNLCMMTPSDQAPQNWRMDQTEAAIREFILQVDPDFVFFQELPGMVPYVETHELLPANTVSHCGNIATLVRAELMPHVTASVVGNFAVLATVEAAGLTLANVHLESGADGAGRRREMIATISNGCETESLAIVGDTNSRLKEEERLADFGLSGKKPPKATWDTRANRFRDEGPEFTAYFTRYFHNEAVQVTDVEVWDEPLETEWGSFHLSDHFALSGTVHCLDG